MFEYASQGKVKFFSVVAAMLLSCSVVAQVRVVEAGANSSTPPSSQASQTNSASAPTTADAGNRNDNDIVVTLYNMLESLQQEVQMLRGMVEEQGYQIRRMEAEQRDRYLDVDNRLSVINQRLNQGGGSVTPLPGNTGTPTAGNNSLPSQGSGQAGIPVTNQPANPIGSRPLNAGQQQASSSLPGTLPSPGGATAPIALNQPGSAALSEEELYQEARNLLLNDADYEASVGVFQQMIERFPNGRLAPNAYYWQGEALILVERFSQAINVFNAVINNFPSHEKAPDSMLKLGIVYSLMNNEQRAQEVWRDLLSRYANSGSGSLRLAEVYLRNGYNR